MVIACREREVMSAAARGGLRKLKLALIQLSVGAQKSSNLERAGSLIRAAAKEGAKLVTLPVSTFY